MPAERLEPHKRWPAGRGGREGEDPAGSLIAGIQTQLNCQTPRGPDSLSVPAKAKVHASYKTPKFSATSVIDPV